MHNLRPTYRPIETARSWLAAGLCAFFMCFFAPDAAAKTTATWTGNVSTDWNTAGNWQPQVVPSSGDDVLIGTTAFVNQPSVSNTLQCATLVFGSRQAVTLTINTGATLTISGAVTELHSEDNTLPYTIITGSGSLVCQSLLVGDGTPGKVVLAKQTKMVSTLADLQVSGNVYVNSVTAFLLSGGLAHNNGLFSLQGGIMTVGGQVKLTNLLPSYLLLTQPSQTPSARFQIDIVSDQSPKLKLAGGTVFSIADSNWDQLDLYNFLSGSGAGTVEYSGGNQTVLTLATTGLDRKPKPYQNLVISGTGIKSTANVSGDSLIVGGYMTVLPNTLDLQTTLTALKVGGDFDNSGTVKLSKAIFAGGNFTNNGQLITGADTIKFPGDGQMLADHSSGGTAMNMALFKNGTKTITAGKFVLPAGGSWLVADHSTDIALSPGAQLNFKADNTGQSALTFAYDHLPMLLELGGRPAQPSAPGQLRSLSATLPGGTDTKKLPAKMVDLPRQQLSLRLSGNDTGPEVTSIYFKSGAASAYMPSEDVIYLGGGSKKTAVLYSYSSDQVKLAANSQPLNGQGNTVRLFVDAFRSGIYSIGIYDIKALPLSYRVLIKDKLTGSVNDLRVQPNYVFKIDKRDPGSFGQRFEISITPR